MISIIICAFLSSNLSKNFLSFRRLFSVASNLVTLPKRMQRYNYFLYLQIFFNLFY